MMANSGFPLPSPEDPASLEVVPKPEALDENGQLREGSFVPLFGEEDVAIQNVENVGWLDTFMLKFVGTRDLGVFEEDPFASLSEDEIDALADEQRTGKRYQANGSYSIIKRGEDPTTGTDLFWDPWFVAAQDQKDSCPAGFVYSPRLNNANILLPDLQAFVSRLLPPVAPIMRPLDRENDWAYVQVVTNFGVASSSLQSQSAHAEVQLITDNGSGPTTSTLWVDLVAIPSHLMFNPGDGSEPIICPVSQMRYDPDNPGDCSYIYLDSSNAVPSKVFNATVTVLWLGQFTNAAGSRVVEIAPTSATFDLPASEARVSVALGSG